MGVGDWAGASAIPKAKVMKPTATFFVMALVSRAAGVNTGESHRFCYHKKLGIDLGLIFRDQRLLRLDLTGDHSDLLDLRIGRLGGVQAPDRGEHQAESSGDSIHRTGSFVFFEASR